MVVICGPSCLKNNDVISLLIRQYVETETMTVIQLSKNFLMIFKELLKPGCIFAEKSPSLDNQHTKVRHYCEYAITRAILESQ